MPADPDDALHWEGDDELPDAPPKAVSDPALPEGWAAVGKGSEKVGRIEADGTVTPADAAAPLSTPMLVSLGVIGGAYLLYLVGWIVGGLRLQGVALFLVDGFAYQVTMWLAIAAPALWFLAAWVLTRRAKSWVRILSLLAGMAVLIPWPFVMFGSLGVV